MSTVTLGKLHGMRVPRAVKVDVVSAGLLTALLAGVVVAANAISAAVGSDGASEAALLWAVVFAALVLCVRRVGLVAHALLRAWAAWKDRVDSGATGSVTALMNRDTRLLYDVEVSRARNY